MNILCRLSKMAHAGKEDSNYLSLNSVSGNISVTNEMPSDLIAYKGELKKISDRIIDQEKRPRVKKLIERQFSNFTDPKVLVCFSIKHMNAIIDLAKPIKSGSFRREKIIDEIYKRFGIYNWFIFVGINPFDCLGQWRRRSCEILENFEKEGVDFIYDTKYDFGNVDYNKAVTYLVSFYLNEAEGEILKNISISDRSDSGKLLQALNKLKGSSCSQYVLEKLIAQAEVWEVMQSIPKLRGFPFEDVWRFCIDIEFQKFGAYIYENERGFITATLRALCFALKLKSVNYLDYIEINRLCGERVLAVEGDCLNTMLRGNGDENLLSGLTNYGIYDLKNMDDEGLQDLRERSMMKDSSLFFIEGNNADSRLKTGRVQLKPRRKWEHLREVKFLFEIYKQKIEKAKSEGERLICHIWFTRELSLQHHMTDGNGRTAQIVFLTLLANDPDLPMMLLDTNPNLDTNGPVAFVKRVLSGMRHFRSKCEGMKGISLNFEEVDEMTSVSTKRLWKDYHPSEELRLAFIDAHREESFAKDLEAIDKAAAATMKLDWQRIYKDKKIQAMIGFYHFIGWMKSNPLFAAIVFMVVVWVKYG